MAISKMTNLIAMCESQLKLTKNVIWGQSKNNLYRKYGEFWYKNDETYKGIY